MRIRLLLAVAFIALSVSSFLAQTDITTPSERAAYENFLLHHKYNRKKHLTEQELKAMPKYDRPDLAWEQDFLATLDPATGKPEPSRLHSVFEMINNQQNSLLKSTPGQAAYPWVERGPDNVGGRTRALLWDPYVANKVWAAGVTGGLWYNNNITGGGSWVAVDDFWDNISVTAIALDPNDNDVMYVGTGEGYGIGTSRGAGVWKTEDNGVSWTRLASTANFYYVNDIVVRDAGATSEVYLGVARQAFQGQSHGEGGLMKSTDGGASWTQMLPNAGASPTEPADLDLASDNTLWIGTRRNEVSSGGGRIYSSSDGVTFTLRHNENPGGRVKIACAPSNSNYIYAIVEYQTKVVSVRRSTDGGATWVARNEPNDADAFIPANDFTREQGWYNLALAVDPNDENVVLIGGIDLFKSTNGMNSWNQISHWTGNYAQYVHADQHEIVYKPGSSTKVVFGNDGGIAYSGNAGNATPTITHKNNGYNVTQFYAGAIHPNAGSNIFLAGAQDNGTQRYTSAGVNSTTEVYSGDGAYCHIDQTNGNYQTAAYVYNKVGHSNNAGASFTTVINDGTSGKFINPSDLDDNLNILYTYSDPTELFKITGIQGSSPSASLINLPSSLGSAVGCMKVSPYTTSSTKMFIGTDAGKLWKISNLNSSPNMTDITGSSFPIGRISCVEFGATEDDIIVIFSNYGVTSVWLTADGGTTWMNKEGDLPDMPVRWALINPNNNLEVILATEVGVWSTTNISSASPSWVSSNAGLANVRVDMLQTRTSDDEVIAITHGRGIFSSSGFNGTSPLDVAFYADLTNVNTNTTVQLTEASNVTPNSWTWTISPNTFNYVGGTNANSQNPQVEFTAYGNYTVSLSAQAGAQSDTETKTNYIEVVEPPYCASYPSQTGSTQIDRVELNTINNATVDQCAAYSDFTAQSTTLIIGQSYDLTVETASCSGSTSNRATAVFIDWNGDYDFNDPGETVATSAVADTPIETLMQSITVPAGAVEGSTQMRVSCRENTVPGPCDISGFFYGEVEDYTINILATVPSSNITITNIPADITIECNESTNESNTGSLTATTNCITSGVNISYTDATAAGSCANASVITRTWTATDNCTGTEMYVQTITVEDNTNPTITCLSTQTIETTNGSTADLIDYTAMATIADNCSSNANITVTQSPAIGSTHNLGVVSVTLTATDECGNTANCSFDVSIVPPSYCDVTFTNAGSNHITNVTFNSINQTSGDDAGNGLTDFTSITTDVEVGSTHNLAVSVNTAGPFTDHIFAYIDWNHNFNFTDAGEMYDLGEQTNVTAGTVDLDILIPDVGYVGATRMRIITNYAENPGGPCDADLTDEWGEAEDYTVNITSAVAASAITLTNSPVNTTISCDASNLPVNTGSVTATTTCGAGGLNIAFTDATAAGSCANASVITRTWTVTDNCSNTETYVQTITIEDNTNPTISCPTTQTQNATNGSNVALADYTGMSTISDNCSSAANITVTQSPAVGSMQNVGTVAVTLTATDECGNTSNCMFNVTVNNASAITLTNSPVNTTISCDASNLPANTGSVTATTTCGAGGLDISYADVTAAGPCANASVITRTWTVTDNCSNTEMYVQTITIEDNTNPTISCPTTQTQNATNGSNVALADYTGMSTISDNCSSAANITVTQSPAIGSTQNVGTVAVTLTATDECGNTSNCMFNVTVNNASAITLTNSPANTTISCDASNLPANTGSVTATTTCGAGGLDISYTDVTAAGSCANASVITRTWTVTDNCSNTETYVQTITIEDNTNPTISCSTTQTQNATNGSNVALADYTGMSTISDNCSSAANITVTQSPAIGSMQNVGTVAVTLTATDECGNTSNCMFNVEVVDASVSEVITITNFPANITIECDASTAVANTGDLTATTSCGAGGLDISYADATAAGSCANASVITRTWTVTDNCSNTETYVQTITIEDTQGPILDCEANEDVLSFNGVDAQLPDYILSNTITDNCTSSNNLVVAQNPSVGTTLAVGTHTVTITATDECGNQNTCEISVTVSDVTGLDEEEQVEISVYPNPTNGAVIISSTIEIDYVEVINQLGQTMEVKHETGNELTIDLSKQPAGIYVLRIHQNDALIIKRVSKTK